MKTALNAWNLQRWSAMVLALCVVVHLVTMIVAVHSGLTAQAILARLRGNAAWGAFYLVFLAAAVAHVPIGVRKIAQEWLGWRGLSLQAAVVLLTAVLAITGLGAVYGLVWRSM